MLYLQGVEQVEQGDWNYWILQRQAWTSFGDGTGASVRDMFVVRDEGIDGTYKIHNGVLRALDICSLPFIIDPQEAYSRIEDCKLSWQLEQQHIEHRTYTL